VRNAQVIMTKVKDILLKHRDSLATKTEVEKSLLLAKQYRSIAKALKKTLPVHGLEQPPLLSTIRKHD
jgi:hypothetical protein